MIPREILKKVRQIEIRTNREVTDVLGGQYHSVFKGRGYVTPQDVKTIGMDVLRHRVIVSYEAEAEDMTSETIIKRIFDEVPVP